MRPAILTLTALQVGKYLGTAASLSLLIAAGSVGAQPAFDMNWTGPYGTGSAVLTVTANTTDEYGVTSLTGTQGVDPITLLPVGAYGANDNLIFQPPSYTNLVDFAGFGFTDGSFNYNIFFHTLPNQTNTYTECRSDVATVCSGSDVNNGLALTSLTITPETSTVPEPATLSLAGLGLAGIGFLRRRRAA